MKEYPLTCPLCKGNLKIDRRLVPKGKVYVCASKICRSGRPVRKQWIRGKDGRTVWGPRMAEIDLAKESEGLEDGAEKDP